MSFPLLLVAVVLVSRASEAPAGRRAMVRMRGTVTARDALGNATTASFRFTLRRAR